MLRLEDVHRSYSPDRRVLSGVDLDVAEGEILAVLGRSGSGKTTLLNVMGGLDRRYDGSVELAGRRLETLSDADLSGLRNSTLGIVFQAYHLLDHLSCRENVTLASLFDRATPGRTAAEIRRRGDEVLDRVGLMDRAEERPIRLSGGERQRVALARALYASPQLLLCDEPTGNLDADTGCEVVELLRSLNGDDGTTVVVVTHDREIATAATRVVRLVGGALHEGERDA